MLGGAWHGIKDELAGRAARSQQSVTTDDLGRVAKDPRPNRGNLAVQANCRITVVSLSALVVPTP